MTVFDHDFLLFLAGAASVAFLVRGVCQEPRATTSGRDGWTGSDQVREWVLGSLGPMNQEALQKCLVL